MNRLIAAVGSANRRAVASSRLSGRATDGRAGHPLHGSCRAGVGAAAALLREASPCGKIAETWPVRLDDPSAAQLRELRGRSCIERRSTWATATSQPRGAYSLPLAMASVLTSHQSLRLSSDAIGPSDSLEVRLTVRNCGRRAAAEMVQLYVRDVEASVYRPDRELKGFKKVQLAEGATQEVCFCLGPRAFAFYDTARRDWYTEPGEFEILVGSSSEAIHQTAALHVVGGEMRGDGVDGAARRCATYPRRRRAGAARAGRTAARAARWCTQHDVRRISANGPLRGHLCGYRFGRARRYEPRPAWAMGRRW